ncbi:RNA polymerase sigma factor [Muriicola soli]|uniref:Sigma-70 family RNA polymerase sigma factor n=1 Tax=Muriicola soli TaxID=2507538 RepID=A0A411EC33_9FLAO|nr:sigma-70 family RNA polymerase sigma factor [Muriicola soli]QBA65306.1 sigma-70 family RNA polymerase sigma factor [Muriicola soli]
MVSLLRKLFLVIIGERNKSSLDKDHPFRDLSDEELVEKIAETNNTLLFGIIYDRYADKVYTKCTGFARSEDEAEDLTQDVFLTIFIKLGSFKGISKFSSWVYSITYNFCVNYITRNKGRKISEKTEKFDGREHQLAVEAEDRSFFHMRSDKLKIVLEQIPPEDKTLLLLKYQDDVPIKDLCALLDLGESAVKMRLKRAKAKTLATYNALP